MKCARNGLETWKCGKCGNVQYDGETECIKCNWKDYDGWTPEGFSGGGYEYMKQYPKGLGWICACCGNHCTNECPSNGVCPKCGWEEDCYAEEDITMPSGPNHVSLEEARENFKLYGLINPK